MPVLFQSLGDVLISAACVTERKQDAGGRFRGGGGGGVLTVDNHGDVHEVDLAPRLHAGLAAVHALVRLGHLADLQVVVGQNLVPAFPRRRRQETERECQAE